MANVKPRLARSDVGAWVFKGNPQATWDYFAALQSEGRRPGKLAPSGWTLGSTYRTHLVEPGDLMVLWITGTKDPGLYEIGTVTGQVEEWPGIDKTHLVDRSRASKETYGVAYESVLLRHHVPREAMKADPVLGRCEQFVIPVISNPTYLTPKQRDALLGFLAPADLRTAGWQRARTRRSG